MIQNGKIIAKVLDSISAPYAVKNETCKGRVVAESHDLLRAPFQVDKDRIIHCKAFRRLKDKTQVYNPSKGSHFRDRLTHSLEVAQISRGLARNLALNEDLAETIALAHDLGHTPFGHAGEEALNDCMKQFGLTFEHNEQSRRVVTELENLNLTHETLEGLQKHQTPYDQAASKFVNATLEAQIVNIADEIAYHHHDLDDGIRSKILNMKDVAKLTLWREAMALQSAKPISQIMKLMINDLISETEINIKKHKIKTLKDVYDCNHTTVKFSPEMARKIGQLRKFLFENYYYSAKVRAQTKKGQRIIKLLFKRFMKYPPQKVAKEKNTVIIVKDYIAGMTDSYAYALSKMQIRKH